MILSSPAFTKPSLRRFSESWGAQNHRMSPPRLFLTTGGLKLGSPPSSVWRKNRFLPVWRKNWFKPVQTSSQLGQKRALLDKCDLKGIATMSLQSQTTDVDLEAFEELFKWEEELLKWEEEVKKQKCRSQPPDCCQKQQDDFDEMINRLKID